MKTYTLKVSEIKKETKDTVSICFKQPALRKIKYKAGQYLTLIFRINGRRYVRPYSFSSAPSTDASLEITVKRVDHGIVSNHIHDNVAVGDVIEVLEPIGDFVIHEENSDAKICLWGAGSGITPLYAMIKEVLHSDNSSLIYLIYGNRDSETAIFKQQLDQLLSSFSTRLKIWYFYTQQTLSDSNFYIIEGRINKEFAANIIRDNLLFEATHYICGPAGLKNSVKEALLDFAVLPQRIYSEDFDLVRDPKDFEHINTRNINLKFGDIEYPLEVVKGQSILETGLNSGIELPYSCQTGNCSTCKGKLLTGELEMIGLDKERNDLQDNEYLLCCSYPLSDNVYVEV